MILFYARGLYFILRREMISLSAFYIYFFLLFKDKIIFIVKKFSVIEFIEQCMANESLLTDRFYY